MGCRTTGGERLLLGGVSGTLWFKLYHHSMFTIHQDTSLVLKRYFSFFAETFHMGRGHYGYAESGLGEVMR